jgi:aspartate/methionine/tyrosine aminotransferase
LQDTGLALAPGIDFDTVHGDRTVRLSFAGSTAEVRESLVRLGRWL